MNVLRSPIDDEKAFCEMAKKYNILMVPGSSFRCSGYLRLAFCTKREVIENSIPKFKELIDKIRKS